MRTHSERFRPVSPPSGAVAGRLTGPDGRRTKAQLPGPACRNVTRTFLTPKVHFRQRCLPFAGRRSLLWSPSAWWLRPSWLDTSASWQRSAARGLTNKRSMLVLQRLRPAAFRTGPLVFRCGKVGAGGYRDIRMRASMRWRTGRRSCVQFQQGINGRDLAWASVPEW